MRKIFWLEVKVALLRPAGILLVAFSILISWANLSPPSITLEGFALSTAVLSSSLGGLFRTILLAIGAWSGILFSLFIAILAAGSFFSDLGCREVTWSTRRGTSPQAAGIRLAAITTVGTFLIVLGACFALFNPAIRETMVTAGWQYIPLYLAFAWIRIAVWIGITMFFFYLVRSRWAAIVITVMLQYAASLIVAETRMVSLLGLLHRNLISWNFVSPFAPLGIMPVVLFLQGLLVASLVIVLLGAALWVQRRLPELRGNKCYAAKVIVALGVLVAISSGGATIVALQNRVAPFTAAELWEGTAVFDRPYVWSRDFRLLFLPGEYAAIRLPPEASLPVWAEEVIDASKLHRHEGIEAMAIETSEVRTNIAPQSLFLIHPPGSPYPPEWEGMTQRFHRRIQPLLERAQLWKEQAEITFVWPAEVFFLGEPVPTEREVLVPIYSLTIARGNPDLWSFVWALTAASGLDELARCYLSMYLMTEIDTAEVEDVLAWLHEEAGGGPMREMQEAVQELKRSDREGMISLPCPGPEPLCRHIRRKPEAAKRVLYHWQQGEQLGHANYIRTLLEGDN